MAGKKKVSARGAGKSYVTSEEDMASRDKIVERREAERKLRRADVDGDGEGDGGEDEEEEEEEDMRDKMTNLKITKEVDNEDEEEEAKPKSAIDGLIEVENPNAPKKGVMSVKDMDGSAGGAKLSRKEREAVEKERAERTFWEKHERGETEQAKADLARLAVIRKQREEAKLRKEMEEKAKLEAKAAKAKEKEVEEEVEEVVPDGPRRAGPKAKGSKKKK